MSEPLVCNAYQSTDTEQGVLPSGKYSGKTVDTVWAEDPKYVWFLSQRKLTPKELRRYKAFFLACRQVPGVIERALELTADLTICTGRFLPST